MFGYGYAEELLAIRRANTTGQPVVLSPLPNGVYVIIMPGGRQQNVVGVDNVRTYVPNFQSQ